MFYLFLFFDISHGPWDSEKRYTPHISGGGIGSRSSTVWWGIPPLLASGSAGVAGVADDRNATAPVGRVLGLAGFLGPWRVKVFGDFHDLRFLLSDFHL